MYRLNTKIRLTMLCLSGFELYSRWVPLSIQCGPSCPLHSLHSKETVYLNSVRVVVSEIFVALILDFLIFKSCVWDLFYSLKRIDSIWMFLLYPVLNRSTLSHSMYECRDECMTVSSASIMVRVFFLHNWCTLFLQSLSLTFSIFRNRSGLFKRPLTVSGKLLLSNFAQNYSKTR